LGGSAQEIDAMVKKVEALPAEKRVWTCVEDGAGGAHVVAGRSLRVRQTTSRPIRFEAASFCGSLKHALHYDSLISNPLPIIIHTFI
jgi:hypothetical protein